MIRTFQYGEVPNETLFIRSPLFTDVGPVVADILADGEVWDLLRNDDIQSAFDLSMERGGLR